MSITYRLRPEVDVDRFLGGVLAVPNDADIDVKQALEDGDGSIVIDDHEHGKAAVLDDYPPLERVAELEARPATGEPREGTSLPPDGVTRTTELRGTRTDRPSGPPSTDNDDKTEA